MKILLVSFRSLVAKGQPRVNHLRLLTKALAIRNQVHVCHMGTGALGPSDQGMSADIPGADRVIAFAPPRRGCLQYTVPTQNHYRCRGDNR